MGDYEEARRPAAKAATTERLMPQRRPLPKGSDGTKPSPRRPGDRPRPKRSGAMIEAHNAMKNTQLDTTVVGHQHPTGIEGVDAGGVGSCTTMKGAECFLAPMQRIELNSQTRARIANASKNYGDALSDLRVDEVIKKVDELPWYLTLLLGACGTALESVAGIAVRALKTSGATAHAIKEVGNESVNGEVKSAVEETSREAAMKAVNEGGKEAEKKMMSLSEQEVTTFIKTSVSLGKEKAAAGIVAATSGESTEANAKRQALSYTDLLGSRSDRIFDHLSNDVGSASDAVALAIWRSMDPSLHERPIYRDKLANALARYADSPVSRMGRELEFEGSKHVEKEVRIAKIIVPGAGVKYAYMDRVFDGWYRDLKLTKPGAVERSGAYDSARNALSLEEEGGWSSRGEQQTRREEPLAPDKMLRFVEPEFQELAIQKQKDVWLDDPEVFQLTYVHGYPQLVKVAGS